LATEFPLVRLKRTGEGPRIKGRKPRFPPQISYARQAQRLSEVFEAAASSLAGLDQGVDVASDPRAVVPERCLVFELLGAVPDFNVAAQALGLEWLLTEEIAHGDDDPEDEDVADEDQDEDLGEAKLLYLTMPSEQALRRLLAQWKRYRSGEEATPEYRGLWKLFGYLVDLRVWSVQDRLDPSMAKYVEAVLKANSQRDVLVEIDLWYRTEKERRDRSIETLRQLLEEVGGVLLDLVDIEEIRYQGALIRIPAGVARRLAAGDDGIALLDEVMTIRPQSSYASRIEVEQTTRAAPAAPQKASGYCLAAVLDGYPIEQHEALVGRVRVVEVDVAGKSVPVAARHHGTAMASLILNGDLQDGDAEPLQRRVISIPVLGASADGTREVTPEGLLPIGVVYRALRVIIEADPDIDDELANVVVVNHSICDDFAPFVRRPSPWATLLDYFSHQHRLLFVVSAGNVFSGFPLPDYPSAAAFSAESADTREAYLLAAVEQAKGTRGLLSPAESVNSLTVGAVHADNAPKPSDIDSDPYPTHAMTNLASALGLGVNRSVKPDLVERGGRFVARLSNVRGGGVEVHPRPSAQYGQLVATPSDIGDLRRYGRTAGTSNAAALVTRTSHQIDSALEQVFKADGVDWRSLRTRVPILKTLLVHGCRWGDIGDLLDRSYPPQGKGQHSRRRNTIARFIGYGQVDSTRVVSGDAQRITLLGDDILKAGEMHEYVLPIPASMINSREIRTVTLTLSWTCPTTHTTTDHRAVVVKLCDATGKSSYWKGVATAGRPQPSGATSARGTVVHVIHEGKKLVTDEEGKLTICVQATAKTGFELTFVPYALAITLEIAQQQRSKLYAEVKQAIRIRPRVRATS